MPEIPRGLPEAMIAYRARHNIGQRELAKRCKITTQTVGNIENGRRNGVTKLTLAKIGEVLNEGQ